MEAAMQTELRLRLLRTDPESPSGYRIVGYIRMIDGTITGWDSNDVNVDAPPPYYDAIELGVKVGDDWMYAGDTILSSNGESGTLEHDSFYGWRINWGESSHRYVGNVFGKVSADVTPTGRTIHSEAT